jgi:hypothetical protein
MECLNLHRNMTNFQGVLFGRKRKSDFDSRQFGCSTSFLVDEGKSTAGET